MIEDTTPMSVPIRVKDSNALLAARMGINRLRVPTSPRTSMRVRLAGRVGLPGQHPQH